MSSKCRIREAKAPYIREHRFPFPVAHESTDLYNQLIWESLSPVKEESHLENS